MIPNMHVFLLEIKMEKYLSDIIPREDINANATFPNELMQTGTHCRLT